MMKRSHVLASSLIVVAVGIVALSVATGNAQAPGASQAPAPAAAPAPQAPAGAGNNPAPPAPLPPALTSCPELAAAVRTVAANDSRNRDWPNLARYREANHSVGPVDVVFMGDSITDAWAQPRFGEFFPGKHYAGRGISGQTTPQMLLRMRQDVLDLKPKAVVILAGTNDIAGNTGPTTDEEIEGNLAVDERAGDQRRREGGALQHPADQRLSRATRTRRRRPRSARWRASARSTTG